MSNRTAHAAASKDILFIPLGKLKKSPKNVRKVPHTKADIKAFAASIAALGMLQSSVVEPELKRQANRQLSGQCPGRPPSRATAPREAQILRALSEGQVRSDDRRAVFVGVKAYQEAGGVIIRDLFDAEGGGFFSDAELVNRLAREKLQRHAGKVAAEGWRWIVAEPEFDREACAEMRRVFAKRVPLSKSERKRSCKLEARYKALYDKYPDSDLPADVAARLDRIEAAVAALGREEYAARDLKLAGAFVTLAHDGSVRIERGFVRAEDEPKSKAKAQEPKGKRPANLVVSASSRPGRRVHRPSSAIAANFLQRHIARVLHRPRPVGETLSALLSEQHSPLRGIERRPRLQF
jgi:hypothetical protein